MEPYEGVIMTTQPDPVKQDIIDWCTEDNIHCVVASDVPSVTWLLSLGQVGNSITVFKSTTYDDRIYFQSQIGFSDAHRTLVNQTWNAQQRNTMMFNLKKLAVQYDVNLNFQPNGDEIVGIKTFKIHFHSTISKSELLEKHIRMESVHIILLNQLNIELGLAIQESRANENSGNTNTGR